MSFSVRLLSALALVLVLAPALPSSAEVVGDIVVEGNQHVSRDRILLTLGVRIGDELAPDTVREGIRRIYGMGNFSDVVVEAEPRDDGTLRLVVIVEERPRVSEVQILGNDKISESDIRSALRVEAGTPLDSSRLEDSKVAVRKLYESKGFPGVKIEAVSEETSESSVKIVFTIEEGQRVTVKEILFEGNDALSDNDLKKVMATKEDRWWRTNAFLDSAVLDEDLRKIAERYRADGYIDAKAVGYETRYDESGRQVTVTIRVDEGVPYAIAAVEWVGASDFALEPLEGLTTLDVGSRYKPGDSEQTIREAYSWYGERGYIHARIDDTEEVTSEGQVKVRFTVDEQEPAHVGQIRIEGNTRTKEKIIRRELAVKPGDLYQTSEIIASQRRIANLGFFDGPNVEFADSKTPGDVDLVFTVTERQTGRAGVGVSHTSEKGITGFLELTEGNLFGNGQFLDLKWEFGKKSTEVVLGFTEPWFRDRELSVGFDLYDTDDKRAYGGFADTTFVDLFSGRVSDSDLAEILHGDDDGSRYYVVKRERRGGDARVGWPFLGSKSTMLYGKYTLEQVRLTEYADITTDIADTSGVVIDTETKTYSRGDPAWEWRSGATATLVRRTTDRRIHPRLGSYTRFTADMFGGALGGDVEYQRYIVDTRKYVPAVWGATLMLRARSGLVTGYGDPSTVPDDTRFELGGVGVDGLRGYNNLSILPRGESYLGGRTMLIGSAELKFPLTKQTSELPMHGLFFIDTGNTWKSVEDSWRSLEGKTPGPRLYWGAGAGIRVEVPVLGNIGIDMGYGFDEVEGGDWIVHYQFGLDF
jgi:outer membrane protein insertion porin family